ncbi:MAG: selenocysteine-specific translation elongation factor [Gemmatimonadetes bacterium]|nr:selenocysteine-specific translation elongation factor [Gemmatimonadota bacterium]
MPPPKTNLILGTAGHIDHGKTALVGALTGVDTDRLAEEKERGITIELGFARYAPAEGCAFGIVDVPGHEGFVRTMVAGATGMDVVLLVVAADEGVMPQTREHMAIVSMLGVGALVVAVTKTDLVDEEWLDLVREDVRDLLVGTSYEDAEVVPTSVHDPSSLESLSRALVRSGARARDRTAEDLFRLPVDRVFAVEGTGTVATGTLWSGRLARGEVVRILPGGGAGRVRAVQVHGEQVDEAVAGQRTALALTGVAVRRGLIGRGDVLVSHPAWRPSMMLTVQLTALRRSGWKLEAGQRVRVHLGTVEVMARLALFGAAEVPPGEPAFAQLRLEAAVVARSGDRFVIRSYSPVTTIAGGVVLEPVPPKRKRLSRGDRTALEAVARGGEHAVRGVATLAGWAGLDVTAAGVEAGWRGPLRSFPDEPPEDGAAGGRPVLIEAALYDPMIVAAGEDLILGALGRYHESRSLEAGAPLEVLRSSLPRQARRGLADGLAARLIGGGRVVIEGRLARLAGFEAVPSPAEEELAGRIMARLAETGLQGPTTPELSASLSRHVDALGPVLGFLAAKGRIRLLGDAFWVPAKELDRAAARVVKKLGGRAGLGPADFREVLPVTRKHLIPLLGHLDAEGVTHRADGARKVSPSPA